VTSIFLTSSLKAMWLERMVYMPGATDSNLKVPRESVDVEVLVSTMVTVAPVTGRPFVPIILPVTVAAEVPDGETRPDAVMSASRKSILVVVFKKRANMATSNKL
jgi:hypothetical protein